VDALKNIQRILTKHSTSYHLYIRDLRTGQEFEIGDKKAYPICSCFKLAVLMAFFDSLESEAQLDAEIVIDPSKFSPGGGVLNYFTTPVKFTYFQLAQMMMGFSDGTATDILIERVGVKNVDAILQKSSPHSRITRNLKDMVGDFRSRFNIAELKNGPIVKDFHFDDVTNARDLAELSLAASNYVPRTVPVERYRECLEAKRLLLRTALFFDATVKSNGKTGSLGYTFFANDCGTVSFREKPAFIFGISSYGFRHDKDVVELIFGLIGIQMLALLGISVPSNDRMSLDTRCLLE
jgi:hypothetical protein